MVQQYKEKHQLNNITLLHKSWSNNWDDVPQADVILASRSTLVDDLDDMIEKLQSKAKKRVFLTSVTQRHFLDEGVFEAIGRDDVGFPNQILQKFELKKSSIFHFSPQNVLLSPSNQ